MSTQAQATAPVGGAGHHPLVAALKLWVSAYRIELMLFVSTFVVLSFFSSQRFTRQSEAPHFVYQAQSWLDGRIDIDPQVLPNLEDWACVRSEGGVPKRCEGRILPSDKWYSSFPPFPALLMLPFVAIHGYQFNDTSFGVIIGALAAALFYALLRLVNEQEGLGRPVWENVALTCVLCFGTVFFYCAIRGEVWFSAEVMGVALTCLYARNALGARRPVLAGVFFSMAVLTRTPLVFTGIFFLLEVISPTPGKRLDDLKNLPEKRDPMRKLALFAAGAAPLALAGAVFNFVRFGSFSEFGHRFLYNNRVNPDIDTFGLFNFEYLGRNLKAAFGLLPQISTTPFRLSYDPHGLSLLLTLPLLIPLLLILMRLLPMPLPSAERPGQARLFSPLWLTVAACALPGLLYQNDGYMQFGFRFSLDYTPYLLLLVPACGLSFRRSWVSALAILGVLVNTWGAIAFRGYTELMRHL